MSSRPSRATYTRVSQSDSAEDTVHDPKEARRLRKLQRKAQKQERVEYYSTKLHAILWVFAAGITIYVSDIVNVCMNSEEVSRTWLTMGYITFGISTTLVMYMAVWVPRVRGINLEPSVYQPGIIPATTFASILSCIGLIVGLWPVYGLLTPGILGVLWFGALMSAHFLPAI